MPSYEYKCPLCGTECERNCKYDERDAQRCNEDPTGNHDPCEAVLERVEIPSRQGRMTHNWGK